MAHQTVTLRYGAFEMLKSLIQSPAGTALVVGKSVSEKRAAQQLELLGLAERHPKFPELLLLKTRP